MSLLKYFIIYLAISPLGNAQLFEKASPIIWVPTEKYVQGKVSTKRVEITFLNPCDDIPTNTTHPKGTKLNQDKLIMLNYVSVKCYEYYEEEISEQLNIMKGIKPVSYPSTIGKRTKRFIPLLWLAGVGVSLIVTNLVDTTYSYFAPNSTYNKVNRLEDTVEVEKTRIDNFKSAANTALEIQNSTLSQLHNMTKILNKHEQHLQTLNYMVPHVTWMSFNVKDKINRAGNQLNSLTESFRDGRVNVWALNALSNTTTGDWPSDTRDTVFKSFEKIGAYTYALNFRAKEKSKDTFIHRVYALPMFENIKEQRTLKVYRGPDYFMLNETNNCLKGIPVPRERFVEDQCLDKDGFDNKLQDWRPESEDTLDEPIIFKTLTHAFVFCFPHTIEIADKIYDCPHYTIMLPIERSFKVKNHTHIADSEYMGRTVFDSPGYQDASVKHLKVLPDTLSETKMLENLWMIQEQLKVAHGKLNEKAQEREKQPTFYETILTTSFLSNGWIPIAVIAAIYYIYSRKKMEEEQVPTAPSAVTTNNIEVHREEYPNPHEVESHYQIPKGASSIPPIPPRN